MKSALKQNKLGFTLVELLIVIAIIGILSTVTVVSLSHLKQKARDTRRLYDVAQVVKAVEAFNALNGYYPNPICYNLQAIGLCQSFGHPGNWIPELDTSLPNDPINNAEGLDPNQYYSGAPLIYIYTRDINEALLAGIGTEEFYYILFQLESQPQIDRCGDKNPWTGWSCIGGGNLP